MKLGEFASRAALESWQAEQLRLLLEVISQNLFYAGVPETLKPSTGSISCMVSGFSDIETLSQFKARCPFTTKAELAADQAAHPPFGCNRSFPLERFTRFHQTSGTTGTPLRWLDTPESWGVLLDCWKEVYRAAEVGRGDRVMFAFSFGPFLGFWTAFEAAASLGCLCLPGGGQGSRERLKLMLDNEVTVLCSTPTYAMHLAEVAQSEGFDLSTLPLRRLIVAGEPGGSIPETRAVLERLWPAPRIFDHHGLTEVGPVTFECPFRPGFLHIIEHSYLAEVIDPKTLATVADGEAGELVLTTLRRQGMPVLRYRTGDLVRIEARANERCVCGRIEKSLIGGILGRTDDMVVIRGVNIYPTAVERIVRSCVGIAEYRVHVMTEATLSELEVEIEVEPNRSDSKEIVAELENKFQAAFALRVSVKAVIDRQLPRYELKANRWVKGCSR